MVGDANMSRAKDDASRHMRALEAQAREHGHRMIRLAEHGAQDLGDELLITDSGLHIVLEAKARANLNGHRALAKAIGKVEGHSDPQWLVDGTVLAWKRLVPTGDSGRRMPVGVAEMFCMTGGLFYELIREVD